MKILNFCGIGGCKNISVSDNDTDRSDDEYCGGSRVHGLDGDNFKTFLNEKDLTLVFFYMPHFSNDDARDLFSKVAEKSKNRRHSYAAVNCLQEPQVCSQEGVKEYPFYKVYRRGKNIDYSEAPVIDYRRVLSWMDSFRMP